jgi:hypothetical protein
MKNIKFHKCQHSQQLGEGMYVSDSISDRWWNTCKIPMRKKVRGPRLRFLKELLYETK